MELCGVKIRVGEDEHSDLVALEVDGELLQLGHLYLPPTQRDADGPQFFVAPPQPHVDGIRIPPRSELGVACDADALVSGLLKRVFQRRIIFTVPQKACYDR